MAIGVGLLAAFAGNSFVFSFYNEQTVQVFFEGAPMPASTLAFKNWLFGIIGGTIVGFHLLMLAIIKNGLRNAKNGYIKPCG